MSGATLDRLFEQVQTPRGASGSDTLYASVAPKIQTHPQMSKKDPMTVSSAFELITSPNKLGALSRISW